MEKIAIEKRLGISVKNWRTQLAIPQDELARRSGFHRSYISDVERGARNVSLKGIEKLSEALGISIQTLFADVDSKSASGRAQLFISLCPPTGHYLPRQ